MFSKGIRILSAFCKKKKNQFRLFNIFNSFKNTLSILCGALSDSVVETTTIKRETTKKPAIIVTKMYKLY